jgi:ABC-type branched-subunit amino acid transport system permease subunit
MTTAAPARAAAVAGGVAALWLAGATGLIEVPLSQVVVGVVQGLDYGLLALGLVLVYRTSRVLNFAQGQLGVVAAVLLLKLTFDYGVWYWPAVVAVLAVAAGLGGGSELLLRRLRNRPRVLVMVATIGLAQVLFLLTVLPFVSPHDVFVPYPLPFDWTWEIGGHVLQPGEVLTLIVAPAVALALAGVMAWTPWGLSVRASSENVDSARLSGIWVRRTSTIAWMVAGVLSAVTAILASPGQASALREALPPGVLLRALAAALIGAMFSFTAAFAAGIAIGVIQQLLAWNVTGPNSTATIELVLFVLLLAVLVVRTRRLTTGTRTAERAAWSAGSGSERIDATRLRAWVGRVGTGLTVAAILLVPLVASPGRSFLLARMSLYAVIALSLTVLTGWAGQVSLGQFGLVAVGAVIAARLGDSMNLLLLLVLAGAVAAVVAVIIGLPALRIRGLYLAVSTLGFALFMQAAVLPTPCWTAPVVDRQVCTGFPDPASTLIDRPSLFGISLASDRAFAYFALAVLAVFVIVARLWRDRGIARRLIAVRDNEGAAAAAGIPVVRTKLMAFALSGFMAGVAGACLAFALERFAPSDFAAADSIVAVSMVVIGGLGSVLGALLGAAYLIGLPAALGSTQTVQFLTSGIGLLAFLLYLPGGLARLAHSAADLITAGILRLRGEVPGPAAPEDPVPVSAGVAG